MDDQPQEIEIYSNCIFHFESVRKKTKALCTVILEGHMNYRGISTKLKLILSGIRDINIEKEVYIEDEILNILKEDLAAMFNTGVQPYTKENVSLGRKLCKYIVYNISNDKDKTKVTREIPEYI
ncbi:MAG TPA: hypothetical protein VIM70_22635 [Clostridium sp.]|uniref:hypothetical protein n=1 Tax=Clostridium sp. TaxID=1506 RepID=UPI002F92A969